MQILVVSGFLGAGKTTFIKELSKRTKKKIAILENEYGEESIDGDRLSKTDMDQSQLLNVLELSEGCICCSTKKDLALSVVTIANTINPDILVIEPTGLAVLSNIIFNLKKVTYSHIGILNPITILDMGSFRRYEKEYKEIYMDQIKTASDIIISKAKNSSLDEKNHLTSSILKINPKARIHLDDYKSMPDTWWSQLINQDRDFQEIVSETRATTNLDQITLSNVSLVSESDLLILLDKISRGYYGNIIRGKGLIKAGNNNLQFDYVDKTYSITGVSKAASSLVFIGQNIDKSSIERLFIKNPISIISILKKFPSQNFAR